MRIDGGNEVSGIQDLASNLARFAVNGTNLGLFKRQNEQKRSPRYVPFCAIVAHLEAKSDISSEHSSNKQNHVTSEFISRTVHTCTGEARCRLKEGQAQIGTERDKSGRI